AKTSSGIKWVDNVDLSQYNKGPQTLSGTTTSFLSKLLGAYYISGEVRLRDTGITIERDANANSDSIYFNYDRTRTNPDDTLKRRWRIGIDQINLSDQDRLIIFSTLPDNTRRFHLNI